MNATKLPRATSAKIREQIIEFVCAHDAPVNQQEIARAIDPERELPKTTVRTQIKNACSMDRIHLHEDRGRGGRWYKAGKPQPAAYELVVRDGQAIIKFDPVHAPAVTALLASVS